MYMNGYDFDDTILKGNSMCLFFLYCMVRLPYLIFFIPVLLLAVILHWLHILSKNRYLHMISLFIAWIPNTGKFTVKFWDKYMKRIKPWYLAQKRDDDIIVSASPQFLIQEACDRLGVDCIGTQISPTNAKRTGRQYYGEEKVIQYKARFGDTPLATYYSDSMSDVHMFEFAEQGYLVKGNKVTLLYENGVKLSNKK